MLHTLVSFTNLEERLDEVERQLETLIGNLPGLVYRCRNDADWTMILLGGAVEAITGHPSSAFLNDGLQYGELIHPDDRQRVWDEVQAALDARRRFELDYRVVARSGDVVHVWEQGVGVHDRDGTLRFLEGYVVDVTARRRFERRAVQTQKLEAVGRLAGGVAHDFKNVLTGIMGCADLALQDVPDDGRVAKSLEMILDASERGAAMVRRLLDLSRPRELNLRPVGLDGTVRSAEPLLRQQLGREVRLTFALAAGDAAVLADPPEVDRLLLNLVVNARDAMPADGGEVRVASHRRPGSVELVVADNGSGMDETTRQRVFEPFFTTKDEGQGTGLGLAAVHTIVRQMNGSVDVESAPGQGTAFHLHFPLWHPPH